MKFCPNCGKELNNNSRQCANCGYAPAGAYALAIRMMTGVICGFLLACVVLFIKDNYADYFYNGFIYMIQNYILLRVVGLSAVFLASALLTAYFYSYSRPVYYVSLLFLLIYKIGSLSYGFVRWEDMRPGIYEAGIAFFAPVVILFLLSFAGKKTAAVLKNNIAFSFILIAVVVCEIISLAIDSHYFKYFFDMQVIIFVVHLLIIMSLFFNARSAVRGDS